MRCFLILFAVVLSSVSQAASFKGFSCTNYGGDTVFRLTKRDDKVLVEWELKRGLKSLPLYEGVMNIDMIPIIRHQIEDLKELDVNLVRFSHEASKCKFSTSNPKQVNCDGPAVFETPKTQKINSYTLMTSWMEEQLFDWGYKAFKIRVGLDTPDMHYLITFVYDPTKCVFY